MNRTLTAKLACFVLISPLAACNGGGASAPCPAAPTLTFSGGSLDINENGYSTGPLPTTTTVIYFNTTNNTAVSNPPVLTGSDGSSLVGSELAFQGVLPTGSSNR